MRTRHAAYRLLPLCVSLTTGAAAVHAASIADLAVNLNLNTTAAYRPYPYDRVELLSCDPPLNSVRAAHGNTDWHIDTAHEFLFGVEMDGSPSAANHVPASWTRQHIHVDMTNTGDYYKDDTVTPFGLDTDIDNGIDKTMLFFYAGHGSPTSWSALGDSGTQSGMKLGNCSNGSRLRYYWQCSCEVFAHGPRMCGGSSFDYACPQDFDGSADSYNMRNVYERWGPALDSRLRMACGASTPAYCHEDQMNRIWDNYNNKGYDVADSFIFGLHSASGYDSGVVPLCITTGGWSTASTPLYDTTFTNARNPSGDYYHIQYLSSFDSTAPTFVLPEIPRLIPRLRLVLPEPDPIVQEQELIVEGEFLVSAETTETGRPQLRVDTRSNATYLVRDTKPLSEEVVLSEKDYAERAWSLLWEMGLGERDMSEPQVARMVIQTVPRKGIEGKPSESQKNVVVTLHRVIQVDGVPVKVLGEGGKIQMQLTNDGQLMNLSKVWREIVADKAEMVPVKPYEKAYDEALRQLKDANLYELARAELGYKAESGNVTQKEMSPVYQFAFQPVDELKEELPPRMIEIPAI